MSREGEQTVTKVQKIGLVISMILLVANMLFAAQARREDVNNYQGLLLFIPCTVFIFGIYGILKLPQGERGLAIATVVLTVIAGAYTLFAVAMSGWTSW